MTEERDKVLDKIAPGAAKTLREGAQAAEQTLDAAGVEHKAMTTEDKVKALMDKLGSEAESFIGKIFDAPPQGLKEGVMQLMIAAAGQSAPTEEAPADTGTMVEEQAMDAGKALAKPDAGQVKLYDDLIKTQEGLAADQAELVKAIKALAPLNTLADAFGKLQSEVAELWKAQDVVKAQLGGRPRAASQDKATEVTDEAKLKEIQEQLVAHDSFWGRPLKPGQ